MPRHRTSSFGRLSRWRAAGLTRQCGYKDIRPRGSHRICGAENEAKTWAKCCRVLVGVLAMLTRVEIGQPRLDMVVELLLLLLSELFAADGSWTHWKTVICITLFC